LKQFSNYGNNGTRSVGVISEKNCVSDLEFLMVVVISSHEFCAELDNSSS